MDLWPRDKRDLVLGLCTHLDLIQVLVKREIIALLVFIC